MSRGARILAILFLFIGIVLIAAVLFFVVLQPGDDGGGQPAADNGGGEVDPDATPDPNAPTQEPEAVSPSSDETPAPLIEVVVSLQTVPRGWQMTEAELTTDMRLATEVGTNVITNIEDAIGLYARTDVFQGETLTRDMFVGDPTLVGVEDFGPSSLIPEGFVAQAVPMDRLSGVAYALAPGDSLDVMLTFYVNRVDSEFQTLLENSATFFLESVDEESGEITRSIFVLDPLGRVEELPTGDSAVVIPSEDTRRPVRVSIILQNARVIHVGTWTPGDAAAVPTETPTPDPEATATPEGVVIPTPTPPPNDVVLLALSPQQQLVLKYALETAADVDYALRASNDGQIYTVENVDLAYLLERFGIEIPIDDDYTLEPVLVTVTPIASEADATPEPAGDG